MSDPGSAKSCPICGRPMVDPAHRPFCSARCRQVDLSRWLGEVYRVPAAPSDANGSGSGDDDREE
jgi:endogenous inhibitor of DNA gyrase (YacG/DUF329 family)